MSAPKMLELVKLDNGDYKIRWSNKPKKWVLVKKDDDIIIRFVIAGIVLND